MVEEAQLRLFFETKIKGISDSFKFPPAVPVRVLLCARVCALCCSLSCVDRVFVCVQATAITFFKRFFVHHSVMDWDPMYTMVTCVDLACKAEEANIKLEDLARLTKTEVCFALVFCFDWFL